MSKNHIKIILASLFLSLLIIIFFNSPLGRGRGGLEIAQATVINKSSSNNTLKNGLVGWWTFDGADVTSTAVLDKSGKGNNATRNAVSSSLVTGKIGQSIKFPGGGSNRMLANGGSAMVPNNATEFSVTAWAKKNTAGGGTIVARNNPFILSMGSVIGQSSELGAGYAVYTVANGWKGPTGRIPLAIGKWYHLGMTYSSSTGLISLYVNGVLDSTTTQGGVIVTIDCVDVGWRTDGGCAGVPSLTFDGSIDDLRVYNRAISLAEIKELYTMGGTKINKTDTTKPTLKSGLVGHWTMDGAYVNSTQVLDTSGQNNTGTRTAVTPVVGQLGQAMKFNGTSSIVDIGQPANLELQKFTMSGWAKVANLDASAKTLFGRFNGTPSYGGFFLRQSTNSMRWDVYNAGVNTVDIGFTVPKAGTWINYAVTMDNIAGVTQFYVNGILKGTDTSANFNTNSVSWMIGGTYGGASEVWNGSIDDVRVYNRVLSLAEIVQLYTSSGGKINKTDLVRAQLRSGLVGHWTFDGADVTANTTTDRSGSGNDGTRTAVTPVTGKIGQAMKFNGTSSRVAITKAGGLTIPYSVSFWFKTASVNNTNLPFGLNGDGFPRIDWYGDTSKVLFHGAASGYQYSGTIKNPLNNWHLYTVVVPSSSATLLDTYIDGVLNEGAPVAVDAIGNLGTAWNIGAITSGNYFPGKLDDVRVYNRAISPAEIMQLYRMGK